MYCCGHINLPYELAYEGCNLKMGPVQIVFKNKIGDLERTRESVNHNQNIAILNRDQVYL